MAQTCVRLSQVQFWRYKKSEELDLSEYIENGKIPIQNILPQYGPHIHVIFIEFPDDITENVVMNCSNVKSLRFTDHKADEGYVYPTDVRSRLNTWIKQLKLESLWFWYADQLLQFCDGVTILKELFAYDTDDIYACIESNSNVERLCIALTDDFNFGILNKLQHLRRLHIYHFYNIHLTKLLESVNFSGLTEFSVYYYDVLDNFNEFLKMLAERTKLDKLNIECPNSYMINHNTFHALKLFNLTTLRLYIDFSSDDFTNFIHENPAPRLKHLIWRWQRCNQDILISVIQNWKHLEKICCSALRCNYKT